MQVLALHTDVIVFISRVWQTTCTAVRGGDEGFVIDSPVYPDELEALPKVLDESGFPVSGLLASHGDWDHLLGRLAFPQTPLGCGQATVTRLAAEPEQARGELREFDEEHYVERAEALDLGAPQPLPVPGRIEVGGEGELELHQADGHTNDGMAIFIPWARVLVCGDYLSPVEIPMISESGSLETYLETLKRLRPLVAGAEMVVPGHGTPQTQTEALRILSEDVAYLEKLRRKGPAAALPTSRCTAAQQPIHEANAQHI